MKRLFDTSSLVAALVAAHPAHARAVRLVALDVSDYIAVLDRLTEFGACGGGVVYDALIEQTALKAKADEIVTLNEADFARLCVGSATRVVVP